MTDADFFYRDPEAPRPNRPIGVGVLALIENGGALLMDRRGDCGRWGLVGGAVEVEESLDDALRREVREETGLAIRRRRLFGVSSDPSRIVRYPDGNVVRLLSFVYEVEVEDFNALRCSDESSELRFFRPAELPGLDIIETARPIVDRYLLLDIPRELMLD